MLLGRVLSSDKYKIKMLINGDRSDGSAAKSVYNSQRGDKARFPACMFFGSGLNENIPMGSDGRTLDS